MMRFCFSPKEGVTVIILLTGPSHHTKGKREPLENTGYDDRNHLGKMGGVGWVSADVLEGGAIEGHMPSHAKSLQQIEASWVVAL